MHAGSEQSLRDGSDLGPGLAGDSLLIAIEQLEAACRQAAWPSDIQAVRSFLDRSVSHLERHIERDEGPDGLLAYIEEHRPDLLFRAQKLRAEHGAIRGQLGRLFDIAEAAANDPGDDRLRRGVEGVLSQLRSHRQRGTELGFLAYLAETGCGD